MIGSMLRQFALAAALLPFAFIATPARSADPLESPTFLSSYRSYSDQVASECLRNRAYGLSTNGLPLRLFCQRQGDLAAMKVLQDMTTPHRRAAAGTGIAPPR